MRWNESKDFEKGVKQLSIKIPFTCDHNCSYIAAWA